MDYTHSVRSHLFIYRLTESGVTIRYVTNTTKESKRVLVARLREMGFEILPQQIFTSLTAARSLVEREGLTPHLLLEESALEDFSGVGCNSDSPNAVVVGLAPSKFDYEHLNIAFRYTCVYTCMLQLLWVCT